MGRKAAAVAALIGFSILPVHAQSRAGARAVAVHPTVSAHPVRSIPSVIRPRPTVPRNSSVVVTSPFTGTSFEGGTVQDLFGFPTPGLGFDFSHWAAVNGNLGVRALIDPVTQHEIALALRLRGATAGVSPFFFSPFGATPIVVETPMVAAQPEPAPQQPIVVVVPQAAQPSPAPQQQVVEEQPLPYPGEFVLVQRDGRLHFAVGFTAEPGHVVYVTKEGLRRRIALDQLDVDTTLRMNEERGSSIQIPRV
jgi:hypothetical protein